MLVEKKFIQDPSLGDALNIKAERRTFCVEEVEVGILETKTTEWRRLLGCATDKIFHSVDFTDQGIFAVYGEGVGSYKMKLRVTAVSFEPYFALTDRNALHFRRTHFFEIQEDELERCKAYLRKHDSQTYSRLFN